MGKRIIIVKKENRIITSLIDGDKLEAMQVDYADSMQLLGNVYIGKVKNIVKNINAAFVEIAEKCMCYLPLGEKESYVFTDGLEHKLSADGCPVIKAGDELIVQVVKEGIKTKAPVVSANFNLTGKYVVLVHGKPVLGVSAKIKDAALRESLKKLAKPYMGENYGFIIRTNAENASTEIIEREMHRLSSDYQKIMEYGVHWAPFSWLYRMPPAYLWEIRDGYSDSIEMIKTDDRDIYDTIQEFLFATSDEDIKKLVFHDDPAISLDALYGIEKKLERALSERVWLDSGAYLIIQPTEAMTVIDVNTGKAVSGKQSKEETFYKINCEAAEEIANQLRVRNLSGIIVVDFIDMKDEPHKKMLMRKLEKYVSDDRIQTTVVDMTALNLVEITRKKVRPSLAEMASKRKPKQESGEE